MVALALTIRSPSPRPVHGARSPRPAPRQPRNRSDGHALAQGRLDAVLVRQDRRGAGYHGPKAVLPSPSPRRTANGPRGCGQGGFRSPGGRLCGAWGAKARYAAPSPGVRPWWRSDRAREAPDSPGGPTAAESLPTPGPARAWGG